MPKQGFRSITVSHAVYERFNDSYLANKEDLAAEGIRSITGYISGMLEEALRENEAARRPSRLRMLHVDFGRIVLMDAESGRVAEVVMRTASRSATRAGRTIACTRDLPTRRTGSFTTIPKIRRQTFGAGLDGASWSVCRAEHEKRLDTAYACSGPCAGGSHAWWGVLRVKLVQHGHSYESTPGGTSNATLHREQNRRSFCFHL